MSKSIDLKALERKAWRSVFQDGLWDIYLGIILSSFAVNAWLDKKPIEDDLRMIGYIGVMVLGMVVLFAGKRFITMPRLGRVKFGVERRKKRRVVQLVLFISVLIGLLLWWLSAVYFGGDREVPSKWMFPAIWVLNVLAVFGLSAYFFEYERLYLIGFLYALVLPLDVYIKDVIKADLDVYIFLAAALVILAMGLSYLVRFVREYKPVDLSRG